MLLFTLLLTGTGSLYTAFVGDYTNFIIARVITGISIGAGLAIVNTYINEVAPRGSHARYTSLIFIMSALGAFFGIWLGLWLTTPPGDFPYGLPFAQATVQTVGGITTPFGGNGWRIMDGIGAVLALVGILLRFQLPESPRWLISKGRVKEADEVVTTMETHAHRRLGSLPAPADELPVQAGATKVPYTEIFTNPLYLRRTLLLVVTLFLGYVTIYAIAQGLATLLAAVLPLPTGLPPEAAGAVAGEAGMLAALVLQPHFCDRLRRAKGRGGGSSDARLSFSRRAPQLGGWVRGAPGAPGTVVCPRRATPTGAGLSARIDESDRA